MISPHYTHFHGKPPMGLQTSPCTHPPNPKISPTALYPSLPDTTISLLLGLQFPSCAHPLPFPSLILSYKLSNHISTPFSLYELPSLSIVIFPHQQFVSRIISLYNLLNKFWHIFSPSLSL